MYYSIKKNSPHLVNFLMNCHSKFQYLLSQCESSVTGLGIIEKIRYVCWPKSTYISGTHILLRSAKSPKTEPVSGYFVPDVANLLIRFCKIN